MTATGADPDCPACGTGRRFYVRSERGAWFLVRRTSGNGPSAYAFMDVTAPEACPACGGPPVIGSASDLDVGWRSEAARRVLSRVFDAED